MTNWYEKLKNEMKEAVANDNPGRSIAAANSAWECFSYKWITRNQIDEIQSMLDEYVNTWGE